MSIRGLSRRLARAARRRPALTTVEQRAYLAFVAAQHDLPVDALAAETAAVLALAQRAGLHPSALADWLAAAEGVSPAALWVEAEAVLRTWRTGPWWQE